MSKQRPGCASWIDQQQIKLPLPLHPIALWKMLATLRAALSILQVLGHPYPMYPV